MEDVTRIHYDIPASFFPKFLDPYMKYTSGLYRTGEESLEQASLNMLDNHIDFLRPYTCPHILEIGSGWGALLKRLIDTKNNFQYLAVNPSPVQNQFVREKVGLKANILESRFEEATFGAEKFDVIYLIGSFCHLRNQEKQLEKLSELLAEDGTVIIEDPFFISEALYQDHAKRKETFFVQETVFGYAHIFPFPRFLELVTTKGLSVRTVLDHSSSYKRTVDEWLRSLGKMDRVEYPLIKQFCDYLAIGQMGWHYTIANYLVSLKKKRTQAIRPLSGSQE
ncbi:MAG: class I SAM-dependent methyltransferase [Deltaproteobacteria bacterium]|nr:class I SAM-dependent methyltransferase [Deltaproteobacteria bacterium]